MVNSITANMSDVNVLVSHIIVTKYHPDMRSVFAALINIRPQLLPEDELEVAGLGPCHVVSDVLGVINTPREQLRDVTDEGLQSGRQRGPQVVVEEHQVNQTIVDNQGSP